jgi:hypothetical protein
MAVRPARGVCGAGVGVLSRRMVWGEPSEGRLTQALPTWSLPRGEELGGLSEARVAPCASPPAPLRLLPQSLVDGFAES